MEKEAELKVTGAFERSKWLREGAIYLELRSGELAVDVRGVETASWRYGDTWPRYHQPDTRSSLCASFDSACHPLHTCSF